jgi:hypothetical protein
LRGTGQAVLSRSSARGSEYAQLSRQIKEAGLLERRPGYYIWKITLTAAALATPLALRPQRHPRPLEDILALLTRAGFGGPDALQIYRALFGFLHGHVLNELQELVDNPRRDRPRAAARPAPPPITEFRYSAASHPP